LHEITQLRSEAQRRGYEEGLTLAAERTMRTLHKAQRVYRDSEQNMVELVLTALDKIIGDLPADIVAPKIILNALRELREDSGDITIAVNPEMVDIVGEQLAAWKDEATSSLVLRIVGDDSLGLLDGRLDCGDSVIEAGLPIHLRAVRRALQDIVERPDARAT
jgi:flagellar biosynthesis/type III secretory pathway protein FliH